MALVRTMRDKDILSRSFMMVSSGITDFDLMVRQNMFDIQTCYFSTAVGDNKYVNPLPGFSENTDPGPERVMEGPYGSEGPFYKRMLSDNATILTITPGVPEYTGILAFCMNMFDYSASVMATKGRSPSWVFYVTQAASAIAFYPLQLIGVAFNFLAFIFNTPRNQWYYVKPAMGPYYAGAQGILNDLLIACGYNLTVLPTFKQQTGSTKKGDRDYVDLDLLGYGSKSRGAEDNIAYMKSAFPDAVNDDGTLDILKISTRGVRKYRHFLNAIKDWEMNFKGSDVLITKNQKETKIKDILSSLVEDPMFMTGNKNVSGGLAHYYQQEIETTGKLRDGDGTSEITNPEMASSFYDPNLADQVTPRDSSGNILAEYGGSNKTAQDILNIKTDAEASAGFGNNSQTNQSGPSNEDMMVNNIPKVSAPKAIDESGYFGQIGEILKDGWLGGFDSVSFRVENSGSVSDSFSASTEEPAIAGAFNNRVRAISNFKFSAGGGNTGIDFIDGIVGYIKDGISGFMQGTVVGQVPLALLGNSYVRIPEYWTDTSANLHSETFSIYLHAPFAHPYSIITNILVPLSLLMPLFVPQGTGGSTYTAPFIFKAFCRGRMIGRTCIARNVNLTFGEGPMGWTKDMKPLNCRIDLTVDDLDKMVNIHTTRVTNVLDIANVAKQSSNYLGDVGKYNDWIARIAGQDYLDTVLKYEQLNKRLTRFTTDVKRIFSPSNIAGVVDNSIVGDVARIFVPRPLNR